MNDPDSNAWVFDSLVGFLHGPVWNVPLQTFIEEKSLPFEPTDSGEVIDRPEYKKIHDEYRNLVDVMLGSFMDDIGISADQFEAACRISAHDLAELPAYFHKRLFEQIWAANDYDMFVKMMTHKNVELQLQALELIEQRYGVLPNLFSSDSEDLDTSRSEEEDGWQDNDDVMTEIKKLQLNDSEGVDDAVTVPPEDVVVSEEDVRARQEYLKQQRDKLLALKKQVREKQLGAAETPSELGGEGSRFQRPCSARAAQAALKGSTPQPPPDAMQLRRALASKLKAEVVDIHN
ncbi:Coiled-coil domain-containing protein 104 [Papilio xuthus]|uniref:Cilia- and flagella-associated protein 36 n=1 Tax=Papilio xuthus TaxID=66420 RepID=A0A194PG57_PAPXU|nr:Coiled-coil domain-containing protein 104 [Papilio xuthus]